MTPREPRTPTRVFLQRRVSRAWKTRRYNSRRDETSTCLNCPVRYLSPGLRTITQGGFLRRLFAFLREGGGGQVGVCRAATRPRGHPGQAGESQPPGGRLSWTTLSIRAALLGNMFDHRNGNRAKVQVPPTEDFCFHIICDITNRRCRRGGCPRSYRCKSPTGQIATCCPAKTNHQILKKFNPH